VPEIEVGTPVEALVRLVEQQHVGLAELGQHQVELLAATAGELPCLGSPDIGPVQPRRVRPAERPGRRAGQVASGADQDELIVGREQVHGAAVRWAVPDGAVHADRPADRGNLGAVPSL
jgi:hypothetical protein